MSKQSPVSGRRQGHPLRPEAPDDLLDAAAGAAAALGTATDEIDEAAADALRVNRTDLRILGLVSTAGAMTAGALAEAARLSPAATTAAIQRLVATGHLRRDTDPADRRRAVVTVTTATAEAIDRLYRPIAEAGRRVLIGYTAEELRLIIGFLQEGRTMQLEQAARIRELSPPVRDPATDHGQRHR
ncbi:MarR family transcriptional regulator [Actinoplanes sp. NPDC023801]|uniref:MarR family transcriptional regulator n=1 Tax=Actinoplanes sp. NPDC023801 TaxID=3154595 RepID=UPI0033E26D9D